MNTYCTTLHCLIELKQTGQSIIVGRLSNNGHHYNLWHKHHHKLNFLQIILAGACCPTRVKLKRMANNNSLRVYWRSLGSQTLNHTVELYGTGANYTCISAAGSKYCDILEEMCGDVYTVLVAPVGQDGVIVSFCQRRTYSGES